MPGMMVYNNKLGMWVFLLSEVMFFTSLIGSYVILRFAHPDHWTEPGIMLNVPLTAVNTFLLICSSVTMVKAFAAIQQGDQKGLQKWLLATILIGASFVGIQADFESRVQNCERLGNERTQGFAVFASLPFFGDELTDRFRIGFTLLDVFDEPPDDIEG